MKIRIKSESGMPCAGIITTEDGTELEHICAVDISIRPNESIKARLEFTLVPLSILAEAVVSEEHLRELAAAHGFDLVKKESGVI